MHIVGQAVTRLRWAKGWPIAELASKSGVSADTITAIEDGKSKGSPRTARRLAEALGVTVLDITAEGDGVIPLGAVGQGIVDDAAQTQGDTDDGTTRLAAG